MPDIPLPDPILHASRNSSRYSRTAIAVELLEPCSNLFESEFPVAVLRAVLRRHDRYPRRRVVKANTAVVPVSMLSAAPAPGKIVDGAFPFQRLHISREFLSYSSRSWTHDALTPEATRQRVASGLDVSPLGLLKRTVEIESSTFCNTSTERLNL